MQIYVIILISPNHDPAVRAAIVYSLFSCCKAAKVETRALLEDVLKRIPSEKNILPSSTTPLATISRHYPVLSETGG